jgi:hypothetical protein
MLQSGALSWYDEVVSAKSALRWRGRRREERDRVPPAVSITVIRRSVRPALRS